MGDRNNIIIEKDNCNPAPIVFYSHWSGSDLGNILKAALLRGKDRWNDAQYLPRIIFCEMVQNQVLETTGFGISTYIGDGCNQPWCVNIQEQKVKLRSADKFDARILKEWTFKEYVNIPDEPEQDGE